MKSSIRIPGLLLAAALVLFPASFCTAALAQPEPNVPANAPAPANATQSPKSEAQPDENEALRHSGAVQWLADHLHVNVETAAKIFEDLNSGVLIVVIAIFLARALPKAFGSHRQKIQTALVDARTATEQANERLAVVEQRLSRLDSEIEAIRRQAERDGAQDEVRIKQSLEEERRRIVESAGHEVESAGVAAQRRLKQFAAELAIERATRDLHLTPEDDRQLVSDFGRQLNAASASRERGGRN